MRTETAARNQSAPKKCADSLAQRRRPVPRGRNSAQLGASGLPSIPAALEERAEGLVHVEPDPLGAFLRRAPLQPVGQPRADAGSAMVGTT